MTLDFALRLIIAQSGVIFALIVIHRVLLVSGVISFEFKNLKRVRVLFDWSFYIHIASVFLWLIIKFV